MAAGTAPSSGIHISLGMLMLLRGFRDLPCVSLRSWYTERDQLYTQSHNNSIHAPANRHKPSRLCHMLKTVKDLTVFPEPPLQHRVINYNKDLMCCNFKI